MGRAMLGLPVALLLTAALFLLMEALVRPEGIVTLAPERPTVVIPTVPKEIPETRASRFVDNELPPAPPPISTAPRDRVDPYPLAIPQPTARSVAMDPAGDVSSTVLTALVTMNPAFPASCQARGTEGYAMVRFDVTFRGQVTNAKVVDSSQRCFEGAALRAIEGWRYRPAMTTERGYLARGVTKRFVFQLN